MSKVMLALLAFLLFITPLGMIEGPWCAVQNSTTVHACDHVEQLQAISYGKLHVCDCSSAALPVDVQWTAAALIIIPLTTEAAMPQTAVMMPPTPPPRLSWSILFNKKHPIFNQPVWSSQMGTGAAIPFHNTPGKQ